MSSKKIPINPPQQSHRTKAREFTMRWFSRTFGCEVHDYGKFSITSKMNEYLAGLDGVLLDAACGYGNVYLDKKVLGDAQTVGLDVDSAVLDKNSVHDEFIIQDIHEPIQYDKKFSAIVSVFTWEHLRDPLTVLGNFQSAMHEDGVLCIVAPQKWHYIALLERLLPRPLKDFAWRLVRRQTHMPYPAYYRFCTKQSILAIADESGFEVLDFSTRELPPIWFLRFPPLFMAACAYMVLLNRYKIFSSLRSTFTIVLRKKKAHSSSLEEI